MSWKLSATTMLMVFSAILLVALGIVIGMYSMYHYLIEQIVC